MNQRIHYLSLVIQLLPSSHKEEISLVLVPYFGESACGIAVESVPLHLVPGHQIEGKDRVALLG